MTKSGLFNILLALSLLLLCTHKRFSNHEYFDGLISHRWLRWGEYYIFRKDCICSAKSSAGRFWRAVKQAAPTTRQGPGPSPQLH